jgi:HAD superfamily hydrolase (TIGR01509 family)
MGGRAAMIEAVIFDMDGLMVDTERLARRFWYLAFEEFGAAPTDEQYLSIIGRNAVDSTAVLQEALGSDFPVEECRARMRELYYAEIAENGIPVMPGLRELVDFLKAESIRYAVATSTSRDITLKKLEMTNLISDFETIVAGDEITNGKPDPEIFLKAAGLIDAAPEKTVVLEDSFNGVRAAHAAGMIPIMVPDLAQPTDEIRALAHAVVPSLREAQEIISQLLTN